VRSSTTRLIIFLGLLSIVLTYLDYAAQIEWWGPAALSRIDDRESTALGSAAQVEWRERAVSRRIEDNEPTATSLARRIAKKYGVEVVWKRQKNPIKTSTNLLWATEADPYHLNAYVPLLASEILLYPPEFVRRSGLKRIILCGELDSKEGRRGGYADAEHGDIYLDVERGSYSKPYKRLGIHHEFFHFFDYRDDGRVFQDERWERLNSDSFRYAGGGVTMQDDPTAGLTRDIPGFLTRYAMSGVEEDKAEMFSHMMVEYRYVRDRAIKDRVIGKKWSEMKDLLRRFSPDMDEAFWETICLRPAVGKP